MADDQKLVETVARAILAGHDWTVGAHIGESETSDEISGWAAMQPDWQEAYRKMARAALVAINASGTHWVMESAQLEVFANKFMERYGHSTDWEPCVRAFVNAMRTAYLAKTETNPA